MGNKASAKQRKREREKEGKETMERAREGERTRAGTKLEVKEGKKKKVGVQNIQYNFVGVENCWNIRTSINRETKQNKLTITGEFQQIKMEITGIN